MSEENSFVRCLLVDFSKAFDVVTLSSYPKSADLTFRPTFAIELLASLQTVLNSAVYQVLYIGVNNLPKVTSTFRPRPITSTIPGSSEDPVSDLYTL